MESDTVIAEKVSESSKFSTGTESGYILYVYVERKGGEREKSEAEGKQQKNLCPCPEERERKVINKDRSFPSIYIIIYIYRGEIKVRHFRQRGRECCCGVICKAHSA